MYGRMLFLLSFTIVIGTTYALQISEVMYNPLGTDTNHEWIELYNNDMEIYNITEWKIYINGWHDIKAANLFFLPDSFVIISENNVSFLYDHPDFNGSLLNSTWNGMSNSGDEIIIKNSSVIFDNITYNASSGANGNNRSLCRVNDTFIECDPTPGAPNIIVQANTTYNETNTTMPDNITNITQTCAITIETDSLVYQAGTQMSYDIVPNISTEVEYWIGDIFGGIVKQPVRSNNTSRREWTPSEIDGTEVFVIFAKASCGNASKIIIVKGSKPSTVSSLEIVQADEVKFGEIAMIKLSVYRGDTDRYAIDVYVKNGAEKLSSVTTLHARNKFQSYNITVPVQIKPNCNSDFSDGVYDVVADGLNTSLTAPITIRGISSANCKTVTVSSGSGGGGSSGSSIIPVKQNVYEITYPDSVYLGEEFSVVLRINITAKKNFTVYSYVFRDNKPVSEGLGDSWSGSWTANRKEVAANGFTSVILKNRIEEGTAPGLYSLRVKIKSDKDEDITREIEVKEKLVPVRVAENTTALNKTEPAAYPAAGFATLGAIKSRNIEKYAPIITVVKLLKARIFWF